LSGARGHADVGTEEIVRAAGITAARYGFGFVQLALRSAMDPGAIIPQPVEPRAHILVAALDECALYIARADNPAAAPERCAAIFERILQGLTPDQ